MSVVLFDIYFSKSSSDSIYLQNRLPGELNLAGNVGSAQPSAGPLPGPLCSPILLLPWLGQHLSFLESVPTPLPSQTSLSHPPVTYWCLPEFCLQFLFTRWMLPLIRLHCFYYMYALVILRNLSWTLDPGVHLTTEHLSPGSTNPKQLPKPGPTPLFSTLVNATLSIQFSRNKKSLVFSHPPSYISLPRPLIPSLYFSQ